MSWFSFIILLLCHLVIIVELKPAVQEHLPSFELDVEDEGFQTPTNSSSKSIEDSDAKCKTGSVLIGALNLGSAGAIAGAAGGSFVPVLGSTVGAAVGFVVGVVTGSIGGAYIANQNC
jgi:hypothetical protein